MRQRRSHLETIRRSSLAKPICRIERLEERTLLAASLGMMHESASHHDAFEQDHHSDQHMVQLDHDHADHGLVHEHHEEEIVSPFPDLIPPGSQMVTARQYPSPADSFGPNIRITSIRLVDADFNVVISPIQGQQIRMQVFWETESLFLDAQYTIHFRMDGDVIDNGTISAGAGLSSGSWNWWRTGFYVLGESHELTVEVDGENTVSETDETDNAMSLNFTTDTTTFPPKMIFPVEENGENHIDWVNYLDVDSTSGVEDYEGGTYAYDGHRGWDLSVGGFRQQDLGIEVYATAAGTVTAMNDGEFDRETLGFDNDPLPTANYVIVDHGSGWSTWYWHLRRDSVQVQVGDSVDQGDVLGYIGSSGISSGAHLHFEIRFGGLPIESSVNAESYFHDPRDYVHGRREIYQTGLTNYWPFNDTHEQASELSHWRSDSTQWIRAYLRVAGIVQGDQLQVRYVRPDGTVLSNWNFTFPNSYSFSNWYNQRTLPFNPPLGEWQVEYRINGELVSSEPLVVAATGVPEIRVADSNDNILISDRVTPIDFGEASPEEFPPTQTLTINNHGHETLTISQVIAPLGFSIVGAVPTTIAPGSSAPLSVQLNTLVPGFLNGQLRIDSNDPDEPNTTLTLEGLVLDPELTEQIMVTLDRRATYENNVILGKVRRFGDSPNTNAPILATLLSSVPGVVTVPASVTIPAGETEAFFEATIHSGNLGNLLETILITANSTVAGSASVELDIQTAPKIQSVIINDGQDQRSTLKSIDIEFDREIQVSNDDPHSFIVEDELSNPVAATWLKSDSNGKSTIHVTLPIDLANGNYRLRIDGDKIYSDGLSFDGDSDGNPGGDHVIGDQQADRLFRFYGDSDGDRDVDGLDLGAFGQGFLKTTGESGYRLELDSDQDGDIDGLDLGAFGQQFLKTLP